VVVDLRNIGFADQESRTMFATDPAGGVECATALVANARVPQFLADLFVREKPGRPSNSGSIGIGSERDHLPHRPHPVSARAAQACSFVTLGGTRVILWAAIPHLGETQR
jgi:hypothetical protein